MIKHVGKHNERRVIVLFRQVPGEDHMCLLAYSDSLPRLVHDDVMKCLESPVGQQAENFADAVFRVILADGRNALEVLHKEGMMKKVQTGQVIMTPTTGAAIRLDELNAILTEMSKGAEAVKRLEELDRNGGLTTKKLIAENTAAPAVAPVVQPLAAPVDGVLSDEDIAAQQIAQATRMRNEANALLAEATRIEGEAAKLTPAPAAVRKPRVATAGSEKATKNVRTKKAKEA